MKKFFLISLVLVLLGFGCNSTVFPSEPAVTMFEYENAQYGFSFSHPDYMEVRERPEEDQDFEYLGIKTKFFLSVRDTVHEEKPYSIALFYSAPGLTLEQFTRALDDSGSDVNIVSSEAVTINGVAMTKIISTTTMGEDKEHYLFTKGINMFIISVMIFENDTVTTFLDTFAVR